MAEQSEIKPTKATQLVNLFNNFNLPVKRAKSFLRDRVNQKIFKITRTNKLTYEFTDGSFIFINKRYSAFDGAIDLDI